PMTDTTKTPKAPSRLCRARVWLPRAARSQACSQRAVKDGFCHIHHPDAVAKRRERQHARYEAQAAAQREQLERRQWEARAAQACQGMADPVAGVRLLREQRDRLRHALQTLLMT